jgi:HK97 family phage portal protein
MKKTAMVKSKPGRIRAALLDWLGVPIAPTDGAFWSEYYGSTTEAGVTVSVTTALQLDAVWSCVRLISETIATLPLSMYERSSAGKRIARQHPLHMVLHDQPNPDTTAAVFWESVIAAMLLRGNAHAEKLMAGNRVVGLLFLDPCRLTLQVNPNGAKEWRYVDDSGRLRNIPDSRILHIPGFSLDGRYGVSVIQYGAKVFGGAIAAEKSANSTFQNGMIQNIYYKIEQWLKPNQRAEFKTNVMGAIERGEAPLLEGSTDVKTLGIDPVDAQLLESRGFSVEAICRWFRVPPWMVGHTEKTTSWGTGIEQQMIGFLTFTLAPWLRRIEQAISKDLLTPGERLTYYPKFNVEGLLRADSQARATFYGAMVDKGILTRDEVRELEDREPMGGNAAKLTVQMNMTTLDDLGAKQDGAASLRALLGFNDNPKE